MLNDKPLFSVVIPTYNRPASLAASLEALCRQDCADFEVVVADDGSDEPLDRLVTRFADRLEIRLVRQANAGPAAVRNRGAEQARGVYLAFTDDDCLPDPDWLSVLSRYFALYPECAVGGRTVSRRGDNPYVAASQLVIDIVYRHYNRDPQDARFFASNNLAVPRTAFAELGGFIPQLRTAEDREFCDRWRDRGRGLVFAQEAVVDHAPALSLGGFCRQYFHYGVGAYRYHWLRRGVGERPIEDGLKLHLDLKKWLLLPFAQSRLGAALATASLLVVWQVANAVGFLSEAARCKLQAGAWEAPEPRRHPEAVGRSEERP